MKMAEILDIEEHIHNLMHQSITTQELINRITRILYKIEDIFLLPHRSNTRNMIRACLAYTRMFFVHERLMSSVREYLIHRVTALSTPERKLSNELSILRAASSPENWERREIRDRMHDLSFAPNIREHQSEQSDSSNLDRDAILREMDKSKSNLCKLSEEIVHKREIIHDIDARMPLLNRYSKTTRMITRGLRHLTLCTNP